MTLAYTFATSTTVFSRSHIALTATITAVLALAAAWWRLPRVPRAHHVVDLGAVTVLAGLSVFLWRASANMPQLNDDGLPGFSANDWLAPVITYVSITVYARLRPPADTRRFGQVQALATIASFVVNVITI
ncbi:hypothetical protein AAW14_07090 [Streptomyces hygroscopicus]|uniref:hypothetical protein n=1 Tax=Streptomyces hygroscopicus TaxID=1912 RepID=UPI00223F5B5F|nr:hypothetical protein [Streptomyces hygroscopicus]MCW7941823.1 hypothetical protein [Streptomyces hygroscopicus]